MKILLFHKLGANLFFKDESHLCQDKGIDLNKVVFCV